jgi:antiviral defense system Shedu protein SduA
VVDNFTVSRTSTTSATVLEPTLLSETKTTRLIFRPEIVRKPNSKEWQVKGSIIHQRKSPTGAWGDMKELKLSELRSGEGVSVNLDSDEVSRLIDSLLYLRGVAEQYGTRLGRQHKFVVADPEAVVVVTDKNRRSAIEQLLQRNYGKEFWDALTRSDPDLATRLSYSRIQEEREQALAAFSQHLGDQDWLEPKWEQFFYENQWIFGYGLRYQFLGVEQRQAQYGGESVTGKGGQRGEFLTQTSGYEKFTVTVEIKKPESFIFGSGMYRAGVPAIAAEFVNAISQAQVNSRTWDVDGSRRLPDYEAFRERRISTITPLAILVFGHTRQLDTPDKRQAFHLLRRSLVTPDVITFDELHERARYIVGSIGSKLRGSS